MNAIRPWDIPEGLMGKLTGPLNSLIITVYGNLSSGDAARALVAAVLAEAREGIAAEIERVIGGYPGNEVERPKVGVAEFMNDAQWAAKIAREWHGQEG